MIKHSKNVGAKNIKLLGGNILVNLHELGLSNGFLNMPPKVQATKEKKINRIWIKICASKDTILKVKRQPTEREKIFKQYIQ